MKNNINDTRGMSTVLAVMLVVIVLLATFFILKKSHRLPQTEVPVDMGSDTNTTTTTPGKKDPVTPIPVPPKSTYVPPTGTYQVTKITDIKYGNGSGIDLYLDLYQPKGRTNTPVIVYSHGGGFITGDKKSSGDLGEIFASHGYTFATINYRLSNQAIFPAPAHDLNGAIRFLRANASKYSLDSTRFALMGGSAGSILSSIVGVTWDEPSFYGGTVGGNLDQPTKVLGVVDAFGSVHTVDADLLRFQQQDVAKDELGCEIFSPGCEEESRSLAPQYHLNANDPAYFVLNGELDTVVPVEGARALAADMKAAGMDVTLVTDPKYGHGGDVTMAHMDEILAFLDRIFSAK